MKHGESPTGPEKRPELRRPELLGDEGQTVLWRGNRLRIWVPRILNEPRDRTPPRLDSFVSMLMQNYDTVVVENARTVPRERSIMSLPPNPVEPMRLRTPYRPVSRWHIKRCRQRGRRVYRSMDDPTGLGPANTYCNTCQVVCRGAH